MLVSHPVGVVRLRCDDLVRGCRSILTISPRCMPAMLVSCLRFLARRTFDPDAAMDLLAETFAAAFEDREQFRGDGPETARAWLFAIAQRCLLDFYRSGRIERRALAKLGIERRALTDSEYDRIEEAGGHAGAAVGDRRAARAPVGARPGVAAAESGRRVPVCTDVARALGISEQAVCAAPVVRFELCAMRSRRPAAGGCR